MRGNLVTNSYLCGIQLNSDASEGGDGIISNAVLENNRLLDNAGSGGASINFDGVNDSLIRNNVIRGARNGIAIYSIDGATGAKNNWIVGNTIVNTGGILRRSNYGREHGESRARQHPLSSGYQQLWKYRD